MAIDKNYEVISLEDCEDFIINLLMRRLQLMVNIQSELTNFMDKLYTLKRLFMVMN